jgi:hypothetical protein
VRYALHEGYELHEDGLVETMLDVELVNQRLRGALGQVVPRGAARQPSEDEHHSHYSDEAYRALEDAIKGEPENHRHILQ